MQKESKNKIKGSVGVSFQRVSGVGVVAEGALVRRNREENSWRLVSRENIFMRVSYYSLLSSSFLDHYPGK
jgi:hypothetical protein